MICVIWNLWNIYTVNITRKGNTCKVRHAYQSSITVYVVVMLEHITYLFVCSVYCEPSTCMHAQHIAHCTCNLYYIYGIVYVYK